MGRWELHAELAVGGEVPAPAIAAALEALKTLGAAHYAQGILAVRIDTPAATAEEARAHAIGRLYDVLDRTVAWSHVRWRRSEIWSAESGTPSPPSPSA
jgi:hypothetical protein